jgi:hypothetical protein
LDLVGPFKKAKGGFKHIFIVVDKFTKWIKVKPAASITTAKAMEFIKEIMYKFGVSSNIITDSNSCNLDRSMSGQVSQGSMPRDHGTKN